MCPDLAILIESIVELAKAIITGVIGAVIAINFQLVNVEAINGALSIIIAVVVVVFIVFQYSLKADIIGGDSEDFEAKYQELQTQYKTREDRIEDLEEQLRERSRVEVKNVALPDKTWGAESYQERRQRLLDQASFTERLQWKITGVPTERLEDDEGAE